MSEGSASNLEDIDDYVGIRGDMSDGSTSQSASSDDGNTDKSTEEDACSNGNNQASHPEETIPFRLVFRNTTDDNTTRPLHRSTDRTILLNQQPAAVIQNSENFDEHADFVLSQMLRVFSYGLPNGIIDPLLFPTMNTGERQWFSFPGTDNTTNPSTDDTINPCTDDTINPCTDGTINPCIDNTTNPCTNNTTNPCTYDTTNPCTNDTISPCTDNTTNPYTYNTTNPCTDDTLNVGSIDHVQDITYDNSGTVVTPREDNDQNCSSEGDNTQISKGVHRNTDGNVDQTS
ncbi:hypothetical protein GJ496_010742 [Pomphorhynchus laevis]|nr:hypothetical protein GJ496_010742 [Pomphorhynchus laevis]